MRPRRADSPDPSEPNRGQGKRGGITFSGSSSRTPANSSTAPSGFTAAAEEGDSLERFINLMFERLDSTWKCRSNHYGPYEEAALKRLVSRANTGDSGISTRTLIDTVPESSFGLIRSVRSASSMPPVWR